MLLDTKTDEVEGSRGPRTGRRAVFPMTRIKIAEPAADGKRRVEGYASVFGVRDSYGDIVVKGAFERTLKERPDVKVLYQHDTKQPIGRQEVGYENDYGLVVRGVMSNTDLVKGTVVPLLEDGVINGLSIGYDIVKGESSPDGYLLQDLDLWEWSPVTFPANEAAQVTGVKSLDGVEDVHGERLMHACRKALHELGCESIRWDALSCEPLIELEAKLRGTLAAAGHLDAAHAEGEQDELTRLDREAFFIAGVEEGVRLHRAGHTANQE